MSTKVKQVALLLGLAALTGGCVRFEPQPLSSAATAGAFAERSLAHPALQHFVETNLARPFSEWPPRAWDFETLTLAAFYFHPSLDLARAQWSVARGGIKTAEGRPNPTLSLVPAYNFTPASGITPWLPGLTFDLPLETMGKRGYRRARSAHLAEAARWNIFTVAWQVRSTLRTALAELRYATQRAEGLAQQVEAQKSVTHLLDQRLEAGAISTAEITPFKLSLHRAVFELGEARRQSILARSRVAEAMGLPVAALAGIELPAAPTARETPGTPLDAMNLRQAALQGRADVMSALAEYEAAQSALQLEIARQYPDLHLGTGYQWDQGESKWSLSLTAELPVLNRNQGPIAEAGARRGESAARFLALQARIIASVDAARTNHALVLDQLAQGQGLLAAQEERERAITALQEAGGADVLEVTSARLESLAGRLVFLDVQQRLEQAAAQLEDALQRPFTGMSGVDSDPRPRAQNKSP